MEKMSKTTKQAQDGGVSDAGAQHVARQLRILQTTVLYVRDHLLNVGVDGRIVLKLADVWSVGPVQASLSSVSY
jgi:hypothetical protein